jgi:hypothetical protein
VKPARTKNTKDVIDVLLRDDVLPFAQPPGQFIRCEEWHFKPSMSSDENYFFVGDSEHPRLVIFLRSRPNSYDVHVAFGGQDRGAEAVDFFKQCVEMLFSDNPAAQVLIGKPNAGRNDVGVFATACGASHTPQGYIIVRKD